jgi:hypothetical protein
LLSYIKNDKKIKKPKVAATIIGKANHGATAFSFRIIPRRLKLGQARSQSFGEQTEFGLAASS